MQRNTVVLVDPEDNPLGVMEKMEAHQTGVLHRAFSIFIFNSNGEMLLQQRAAGKYHGGGLWTNACCSHPQQGENVRESALDRLDFEMGFRCAINKAFSFLYNSPVENDLIEHEYDHVFIGYSDEVPRPNPEEVQNYRWVSLEELRQEIIDAPHKFTVWFQMAIDNVLKTV